MSKILRCFVVFLSALIVITACIGTVAAAVPDYSMAFGPLPVVDPEPNLLISGAVPNGLVGWGYSLDPVFTPNSTNANVTQYFDDAFIMERSSGSDYAGYAIGSYSYISSQSDVDLEGDDLSGYVSFNYNVNFSFDNFSDFSPYFSISYGDFYSFGSDYGDYSFESELAFRILSADSSSGIEFSHIDIYYSKVGEPDILTFSASSDNSISDSFNRLIFDISPVLFGNSFGSALYYIHRVNIVFLCPYSTQLDLEGSMTYTFIPDLRALDISAATPFDPDQNPALPLLSYTQFVGNAASGFLDLQIFPGFTIGGILMTLLAFTLVVWFLKVFAGG